MGCWRAGALENWPDRPVGFRGNRELVRDAAEQICRRLEWLELSDRLLLEMIYEQGMSVRKAAVILQKSPSTIARRIRARVQGLFSPEYQICLQHRMELSDLQMSIARCYYVQKKSRRAIARFLGISRYALQRHLDRLEGLVEREKEVREPGPVAAFQGHRRCV
ncbi:MAG: helix-turn-helix domain-containing protein [Anaerohalosphaeraceae bacterium]